MSRRDLRLSGAAVSAALLLVVGGPVAALAADGGGHGVSDAIPAGAADPDPVTDAFLDRVRDTYSDIRTLWAAFTQVNEWELLEASDPYRGELWVDAAGHVAIAYSEPPGHRLVSDGTWMWTYVPESGQVLKSRVDRQGDAVARLFLDFLAGHRVREVEWADEYVELTLEPEEDLGIRELRVEVDRPSALARRFVWTDWDGNVSDYRILRSTPNVTVEPDRFTFEPPDGVDVVEIE